MKVLVTGGLGFIGSHLVEELKGHTVDVVDSNVNKRADESELPINAFFKSDVSKFKAPYAYDQIYHLASPVGPAGVLKYAGRMAPDIINGLRNVLDIAAAQNAAILYVSSSEVYGPQPTEEYQREDFHKIVPHHITVRLEYGVGKMLGEIMAVNDARDKSYPLRIVRFFNTIGERQNPDYGFVVPRFINQALKGEPITVFGSGEQKRCFTYVKDTVDGMRHIMKYGERSEIYNIGNYKNETTINQIAEKIKEFTGSQSQIVHIDPKTIYGPTFEEAWNKKPDTQKLRALNWEAKWSFDDTLKRIIEHHKRSA
ncbi:MAG: NAD-dependent epimerase/dehydratase family protein [Candidatus Aenigmarchaeota archaeon]|nr:NAD-dependent epimerase/dehydratase family protein [Candidatus Aenigmarchaeota archaeon]